MSSVVCTLVCVAEAVWRTAHEAIFYLTFEKNNNVHVIKV